MDALVLLSDRTYDLMIFLFFISLDLRLLWFISDATFRLLSPLRLAFIIY
jgi:hypothetical protein